MAERKRETSKDLPGDKPQIDTEIREKVRELTSHALRGGRVDPEAVKEVMGVMTPGPSAGVQQRATDVRKALVEAVQGLDESLVKSAESAHIALQQLASKGTDFTDNDLKETLAKLQQLQDAYVATVNRVADAASGNIQRELRDLAAHVQNVGVDTSARVAAVMSEFASRLTSVSRKSASSGLDAVLDVGGRTASLASGVLAGIADALGEQSVPSKKK